MTSYKGLAIHLALLGVMAMFALKTWTKDDGVDRSVGKAKIMVWAGSPGALKSLSFVGKDRKVSLTAQKDAQGSWYIGRVTKTVAVTPPHHPPVTLGGDSGVDGGAKEKTVAKPKKKTEVSSFVGVGQARKLVESLVPLRALRQLGKIPEKRFEEFGLDQPEGTLKVEVGSLVHELVIGAATPGGGDRYARVVGTGEVFAIEGTIAQNVMFAESRLIERDLHGFEKKEIQEVVVSRGSESRSFVRVKGKDNGWARASRPTVLDETVGNWMSKVDRLRIMKYLEKTPGGLRADAPLVQIAYFGKGKRPLGKLELYRASPAESKKSSFVARTEQTRWYAEVLSSNAEQVADDVKSVLK